MTGSNDNHLMFRVGQIHAMVKQIHTTICVSPPKEPVSKSLFPKGMFAEIGKVLPRIMIPIAWPYLVAFGTWILAMIVLGYKLVLRFIVGS